MDCEYIGEMLGNCWEHVGLSPFALDNEIFQYAVLGHCGIDVRQPHFFLNFQSIATSFFTGILEVLSVMQIASVVTWSPNVLNILKPYRKVRSLKRFLVSIKLCDDIELF